MLRKNFMVLFIMFFLSIPAAAVEVGGVNLPDTLKDLILNGAGKRTKLGIGVYVAGLYLKQKSNDGAKIAAADEPMAVQLVITSGMVSGEKMETAIKEGFENSTNGNVGPLKDKIDTFNNIFKAKVSKGDIYEFTYVPGKGVEVYKNNVLSSVIPDLDFKKALFGIWLCDKPAQKDLKAKMLGN